MAKIAREKFKTLNDVFDIFTEGTIHKLITQGYLRGLESPISIGKEANIFSALTEDRGKVIVKIYRLETCDFNRMFDYIRNDPRYTHLKNNKRKTIFAWTQREYRNLHLARQAGVRVPKPITFKNNVLVMEFIGKESAAPRLKDGIPKKPEAFLKGIADNMSKLYRAGLVHSDLSAFNILNNDESPVLIDFSQCTSIEDSRAEEYFNRDIHNICEFFRKIGINANEDEVKSGILASAAAKV